MDITHWLFVALGLMSALAGSLFITSVVREQKLHDAVRELREISKTVERLSGKFETATRLDDLQQSELRQMLHLVETRLLDAIRHLRNERTNTINLHDSHEFGPTTNVQGDGNQSVQADNVGKPEQRNEG